VSPRKVLLASLTLLGLTWTAPAIAAPEPLDPIEITAAPNLIEAQPWIAPDGGQLISFKRITPGGVQLLTERRNGGPFADPVDLSDTGNSESPDLSFTPDGGVYAVWGIATTGSDAEQSIRPPGGEFSDAVTVPGCGRFSDSAAGPDGGLALVCSYTSATVPRTSNVRFSQLPSLGPFSLSDLNDRIQPVYDNFIDPKVAWGADGTLAFAARYKTTITDPPPVNETTRIRIGLPDLAETADLVQVTEPDRAQLGGLAVTPDGRVAVTYSTDAGPLLRVRPAGPVAQPYSTIPLPGEEVTEPVVEAGGDIHAMSVIQGPPRAYYANVLRDGMPAFESAPIPLAGAGDPYIPYEEGFRVAADGTEYAVIKADDGVYATSRAPGGAAFAAPVKIGSTPNANPSSAVTPDGDLLVTWIEGEPGAHRLFAGGLDETPPKVTVTSFPDRAEAGIPVEFEASAVDAMGLRSVAWDFGDGQRVEGGTATHAFGFGSHRVRFIATDRAGNETVEAKTVVVPGGGADGDGLKLRVTVPKKLKFKALARRGVKVKVKADRPVSVRAKIGIKRKGKLKPFRAKQVKKARISHKFRIKPKRSKLGKPRKLKLLVRVTANTAQGERVTKTKKVRVRP